ncbi:MAG TPA: cytochrome c biogenesis CcdA family protein [Acidimicrobiales bacterium]|jgi:cytochrome c biogenesis protein CcdA
MIQVHFAYAFTAGLVAALNPCGFPMLPAYLSFFIGADAAAGHIDGPGGSPGRENTPTRVLRALGAGASVSLGFFIVFLGIGLPIDAGLDFLYVWATWLTIAIGIGLFALGIAMVVGRAPKLGLPRLDRGGRTRTVGSMVLFGMSYAIASLGCTVGLFLVVVRGTAEQSNLASGVAAFGAYAAGMSVVLMALSLALAFAREGLVRGMRSFLRYFDRVAGSLLVLVGVYLVSYGTVAIRDDTSSTSPITFVDNLSASLQTWIADRSTGLGLVLATVVLAGLAWSLVLRNAKT